MVKNKQTKNIYLTALIMIIIEVGIKLIGFLKQTAIAYYYGANVGMDIYFVVSDFVNGFSNAVINSVRLAVIGVYTAVRIKEDHEKGQHIISELIEIIIPISVIIIVIFDLFAKQIGYIIAPSYTGEEGQTLILYLRLLSGIVLLSAMCMIFESILNSHEVYFVSKARSFVYSMCIILGCIFFSKISGINVLLINQYLALVIYLVIQLFFARKFYKFNFVKIESFLYIKKIIFTAIPVLIGNSVVMFNYMIDNAIASLMEEGTVSALAYSHVLDDFFVGITISSVTSILFPHFANLIAENNIEKVKKTLLDGMEMMVFILIPISLAAFFISNDIVKIAFFRGEFKYDTLILTALALQGYVLRYPFIAVRDIATQGIYAKGNTATPMVTAIISAIINVFISYTFWRRFGIIAVTIGTTISSCIGMILNLVILRKLINGFNVRPLFVMLLKAVIPICLCVCAVLIQNRILNIGNSYLDIAIVITEIFLIYFVGMFLLRERQMTILWSYIKNHLSIK